MSNTSSIRGALNSFNRQLRQTLHAQLLCQSRSIKDSKSNVEPGKPFILCPKRNAIYPTSMLLFSPFLSFCFICRLFFCSLPDVEALMLPAPSPCLSALARLSPSLTDCHTHYTGRDLCLHMTSLTHKHADAQCKKRKEKNLPHFNKK